MQLLENAAGVVGSTGDLAAQFDAAKSNSLTVVRMFGFGTAGGFQLQYSPGSYNEKAFQAFDKVCKQNCSVNGRMHCLFIGPMCLMPQK